jgi:hypothetical protein
MGQMVQMELGMAEEVRGLRHLILAMEVMVDRVL